MKEIKRRNFNKYEIEVLLALVEKEKDIIDNKTTNAIVNRKKAEAWEAICVKFNSVVGADQRTVSQLNNLYKNMKKRAKSAEDSQWRERLKEFGIVGIPSQSDSDEIAEIPRIIKTETIENGALANSENFAIPSPITVEEVDTSEPSSANSTNSITRTRTPNTYFNGSRFLTGFHHRARRREPLVRKAQIEEEAELEIEKFKREMKQAEEKFKMEMQHTKEKHEQMIRHAEERLQMEKTEHELKMQLLKAQINQMQ